MGNHVDNTQYIDNWNHQYYQNIYDNNAFEKWLNDRQNFIITSIVAANRQYFCNLPNRDRLSNDNNLILNQGIYDNNIYTCFYDNRNRTGFENEHCRNPVNYSYFNHNVLNNCLPQQETLYTNFENENCGNAKLVCKNHDYENNANTNHNDVNRDHNYEDYLNPNQTNFPINYTSFDDKKETKDVYYNRNIEIENDVNYRNKLSFTSQFLDLTSQEAEFIKKLITSRNVIIDKIEKIHNDTLLNAYERMKKDKKRQFEQVRERWLFHGLKWSNVDSICKNNFDKSLAGLETGHRFGQGVNFSPNAHYASNYSNLNMRKKAMILAKVLVSRSCPGQPKMRKAPTGYDTTYGKDGAVIVKYEDNEFYPAYVLHYHLQNEENHYYRMRKQRKLKRLQRNNRPHHNRRH